MSRDVLCCISIRILILHHQLISMHMGIFRCVFDQFFFDTEICFSTVVEAVGNAQFFTMLDGKLFIRLACRAARKSFESWRLGKFVK